MHARKVLVFKDVNYAASRSSATQNTALTPDLLAEGAVGVYGIHEAGSTNLQKLSLITDGGGEAAGRVQAATFDGRQVVIAVGKASGCEVSQPIDVKLGLKVAKGAKYDAPVRGEIRVGYNGTAGSSLNLPTVVKGADFTVNVINKNYHVSGFNQPFQKVQLSIQASVAAEGAYSLLKRWVAAVNLRTDEIFIDKAEIKILHNGTGAVFAGTGDATVTNGSTAVTVSGAGHGVTAGDAISLDGDYYIASAVPTATTITLDRAYQGATGTVVNADTLDITGAATAFGLALVDRKDLLNLSVAMQGDLGEAATVKQQTSPDIGSGGSQEQVVALEKEALGKKGSEDQITSYMPLDKIYASYFGIAGFDLYFLEIQNSNQAPGDNGAVFNLKSYITCAFPSGVADDANKNQSDFEDVMTSLFTTFPAISA